MRGMYEVVPKEDILCSGIGAIERLGGGLLRFWLYVEQTSDETGQTEKLVIAKVVAPSSAVPDAVMKMIAAITEPNATIAPPLAEMLN